MLWRSWSQPSPYVVRAESSSDCPNGVVPCVLRGGQHGIVRHQEEHHCSNRQQRLKPERAPALQSLAARSPGPGRPGKLWPRWGPGAPAAKDPGDCRDAASGKDREPGRGRWGGRHPDMEADHVTCAVTSYIHTSKYVYSCLISGFRSLSSTRLSKAC